MVMIDLGGWMFEGGIERGLYARPMGRLVGEAEGRECGVCSRSIPPSNSPPALPEAKIAKRVMRNSHYVFVGGIWDGIVKSG